MSVLNTLRYVTVGLLFFRISFMLSQALPYLERPVNLNGKKQSVAEIFKQISSQTGVVFSYSQSFNDKRTLSINCRGRALRLVLNEVLRGEPCSYKLKNKYIIIQCGDKKENETIKLNGYIYNARDSTVIEKTSIYVKQTKQVALSDDYGYFSLNYPKVYGSLQVSVAKEEFRDTTLMLQENSRQDLLLYLQPKSVPKHEEPVNTSVVVSDSVSLTTTKDTVNNKTKGSNLFWEELRKSNVNLRNISDTLFTDLSISLVPPISTNRFLAINTENMISFNILVGYSKGVSVFELGGLLNIDNGNVKSAQIGGLGNLVSGKVSGFQLAGLFNQVNEEVRGLQIAGLLNFNNSSVTGAQIGGIGNSNLKHTDGLQIGGIYNWTKNARGFQLAGITNLSDTARGFQLAGLLNVTKALYGVQLALVNVCDTAAGLPIGFFSYVKKGYHKLELSADEIGFAGLGFGTGVPAFHNIFFGGYNFRYPEVWTYGYGLGSTLRLGKRWGLSLDITAQQIQSSGVETKANILSKALLAAEFSISPKVQIGLGPTVNFFSADTTDPRYQSVYQHMIPYSLYESSNEGRANTLWVGAKFYLKFL